MRGGFPDDEFFLGQQKGDGHEVGFHLQPVPVG